ncbi:MAG: nucleotidyl transferase AbiEii/AbiGii toxin family protein [Bryobacteraceae bacterium]
MNPEPRFEGDYSRRQVEAAHRVLVDIGQVLASFHDCIVVVGGWVPDLLVPEAEPKHVGSIDVDLALDAEKLNDGRYAELLKLLLDTNRYHKGDKLFQLVTQVVLDDGEAPVRVDVEFLAPSEVKMQKNHPKLVEGFRVLQFPACKAAFQTPVDTEITGKMITGAENRVHLRVSSLSNFIIMKAHAIRGRDKPKDVYDLCYCIGEYPGGIDALGKEWRLRHEEPLVAEAIKILRKKFETVGHFGPKQLAAFHDSQDPEQDEQYARRAYELVQALLRAVIE